MSDVDSYAKAIAKRLSPAMKRAREAKAQRDLYGTAQVSSGGAYVLIDGAPASVKAHFSVNCLHGDRVVAHIVDHKVVVVSNLTHPNLTVGEAIEHVKENPGTGVVQNLVVSDSTLQDVDLYGFYATDGTIENTLIKGSSIDGSTLTNIPYASIVDADIEVARVADAEIEDATIHIAQIDDLAANYASIADLTAVNASITDLQAADATITGRLTAAEADIDTLEADKADVTDLTAATARITTLESDNVTVNSRLTAAEADIDTLEASKADITYLTANYIDADTIAAGYAEIDLANVNNAWIANGTIKDAAISNEMVNSVSANKLTAGTIDASDITVTNLNASNITTGSLTVDGITIDVDANEATIDGGYIEDGTITLSGLAQDVQDAIDGAIETWTGTDVPTLNNSPASDWTTTTLRDSHVGDVYFVVNSGGDYDGYSYRFTKSGSTYSWTLIKDTDITSALSRITTAEGQITQFDSDISTLQTTTGTLTTRTTSLEGRMDDAEDAIDLKVDTTTFNELSSTVDSNSAAITSLNSTVETKADSSTVTTLSNTVNSVSQTASANSSKITQLVTTVGANADGSNPSSESVISRTSAVEQDLSGFKSTVSETYATKTALTAAESSITQTKDSITSLVANNSTYTDPSGNTVTNTIHSAIQQNADDIELKVDADGVIAAINVSTEGVTIDASRVNIAGAAIFNSYSTTAQMNSAISDAVDEMATRSCQVGNSSSTQTYYWRKFASLSATGAYFDYAIQFTLQAAGNYCDVKRDGVLRAHLRTGGSVGTFSTAQLEWISRSTGITLSNFVLAYKATSGTSVEVELWCYVSESWSGYQFFVDYEATRTAITRGLWTIYDNWTANGSESITDGYTQIASTDINNAQSTATSANALEQAVYKQAVVGTASMSSPGTTWVTATGESVASDTSGLTPAWTTKRPTYRQNYPVTFVCTQRKTVGGTVTSTTPLIDDTTTVIDGGNIITGTVTADAIAASAVTADKIASNSITIGKMSTAAQASLSWYATCPTAAATVAKVATVYVNGSTTTDFALTAGVTVSVTFTYANTASSPTLNVNSTGAKAIYAGGAALSGAYNWNAGDTCVFTYDGTCWRLANQGVEVGGRNLLLNSNDSSSCKTYAPSAYLCAAYYISDFGALVEGETYTIHVIGTSSERTAILPYIGGDSYSCGAWKSISDGDVDVSWTFVASSSMASASQFVNVYASTTGAIQGSTAISGTFYVETIKLERGNTATDWTPAPEDVDDAIDNAAKTATDYITEISSDGIWVCPSGAGPTSGAATSSTSGWHISDAIELFRLGASCIKMWVSNSIAYLRLGLTSAGHALFSSNGIELVDENGDTLAELANGEVTLGNADSGNYAVIDDDSFDIYHGSEEIMHFGYGEGTSQTGTTVSAPYFNIGSRLSTTDTYDSAATYSLGDHVLYDDVEYVCISEISTAESWTSSHWRRAIGNYSLSAGRYNTASAYAAVAMGNYNSAIGFYSTALGYGSKAFGQSSVAIGERSLASSICSQAIGYCNTASGNYAFAAGYQNNVSSGGKALGSSNEVSSSGGIAIGSENTVTQTSAIAIGSNLTAAGNWQVVLGRYNDNSSGNAFEVGWGTATTPKNLLALTTAGKVTFAGHSSHVGSQLTTNVSSSVSTTSGTTATFASITLPAGTWLLQGHVIWGANANGIREINFNTSQATIGGGYSTIAWVREPAISAGTGVVCNNLLVVSVDYSITYYLNCYQNSGSSLGTTGCIKATRIW